jgi:multidrug efflux pump subunit AcrA (membrane-fusion protein)
MIRKLTVVLGAVGLAVFFIAGISLMGAMRPKPEKQEPTVVAPIAFVKEVTYAPLNLTVRSQGEVNPRREIQLAAQVGGRVEMVSPAFANGGVFEKGDILLTIEDDDFAL